MQLKCSEKVLKESEQVIVTLVLLNLNTEVRALKKWLTVLFGLMLAIGLAACGDSNTDEGTMDADSGDELSNNEEADKGATYDAEAAEATYEQQCLSCHGENLQGKVGPGLSNVGARLSKDQILSILKNGKGQMPANLVEGEEAENLASWLAAMK